LRYCNDPEAGIVNYTACISNRDLTTENVRKKKEKEKKKVVLTIRL
jgi:hypothetical protein